ncbi:MULTISPECIES: HAMP domain-containing sensor histidine kinase [unclassified Rathayibacter]|uniref:sensor histidine kinase n=1 Tax=unclassified Rathayibacter TaxID=2609250 RepID=UPI002B26A286|nr:MULTISPECIES: HAMP domain-containing sensor histidine kinase [unclassified Rathayibacter]
MRWRSLSIRVRITVSSLLVAMLFFGIVAIVVREQLDHILDESTIDLVRSGASQALIEESRDTAEAVVDGVSTTLLIALVILFVAFAATSWILVGLALRPVGRMRAIADRLRQGRSTELLPVGPARDELSDLASTLNALIEDLRESADRERQLVADASHELRTPLAALRTRLELAERVRDDPAALYADIVDARRSIDRLQSLTDGLLILSRIDAGTVAGDASSAALREEVTDSVDRARMLARDRDLAIDFVAPSSSVAARYPISPTDFGRILDNLLANAVAATSDGGSITATLVERAEEIVLSVDDDGPGVPESFLAVATDRFTRPDAARSREGGAGLGLGIVAGLSRAAGGQFTIRNLVPHGLGVEVRIPATQPHPTSRKENR